MIALALGAPSAAGPVAARRRGQASGWLDDLLKQLKGAGAAWRRLPPPDGFAGTLRPYQVRGYLLAAFLGRWGFGACLADDMGLGKTMQTLALVQHLRETRGTRGPILLVCPTSVVANWQKEAERFTPGPAGARPPRRPARARRRLRRRTAAAHDIVVSSYALLHRDLAHARRRWSGTGVILDEAQNVKNPETKQAKAARARCARDGASRSPARRWRTTSATCGASWSS